MNLLIKNLSKLYRDSVWGLRDFNLELGPGVLGLVGPNGAGKSTLIVCWQLSPDPQRGK